MTLTARLHDLERDVHEFTRQVEVARVRRMTEGTRLFLPLNEWGFLHNFHTMAVEGGDMSWMDAWDDAQILGLTLVFHNDEVDRWSDEMRPAFEDTQALPNLGPDRRFDSMCSGFYLDGDDDED